MENKTKKTQSWIAIAAPTGITIVVLGVIFVAIMYWISGQNITENFAETSRDFALLFWMSVSLTGAVIGLRLAWWRQQLAKEKHDGERLENLQERFKRAADMLNSNIEWERVGACLVLADLGRADPSMKRQCVRLLFAFINDPPSTGHPDSRNLDKLFPTDIFLRADIQEAIVSFSVIYEHYSDEGIDDEAVRLPSYFWHNETKGKISLIKANLQGENLFRVDLPRVNLRGANLQDVNLYEANLLFADLQKAELSFATMIRTNLYKANLRGANLQRADLEGAEMSSASLLEANLSRANLSGAFLYGVNLNNADLHKANLSGTNLSGADMLGVRNLTKAQILSARWRESTLKELSGPPQLPKKLTQDEEIKKWLEIPYNDEKNKPKDSE